MIFNKTYEQGVREAELEELWRLQRLRTGGDGRLAELGKELNANEPVPDLGEDKANEVDNFLPAAVIAFRVADVFDAHAGSGPCFITRLWMHVAGDIAARVPERKLSPFNRVMALVGTAGHAGFTENKLN